MRHSNWYNAEYMAGKRAEVVKIAGAVLAREISVIQASRELCRLQSEVSENDFDGDFVPFIAINSETDHLPVGDVRESWAKDALIEKDREISKAEQLYREKAEEACKKLIARFG